MKNKTIKTLVLTSFLTFGALTTSSCSAFFGESGYVIKDMTTSYDELTGNTTVIVYFSDDEIKPLTFVIPRGISGVDGVGVKDVNSEKIVEDGEDIIKLTILYTSNEVPPTELKIPVPKDGRGISKVITKIDEETSNTIIEFEYTDGTKSEPIIIPKGIDGKAGVGIDFIEASPIDPSTNEIILTIYYTDVEIAPTTVRIPCGVGIKSITFDESKTTETEYAIKITYSDDSPENPHVDYMMLPIPQCNKWISGENNPSNTEGKDGDFYINKVTGFAYQKINGNWVFMFSMKGTGSSVQYTVTFNTNGGIWTNSESDIPLTFVFDYGDYLALDKFPSVKRDGFKFEGWFSTKDVNPNAGHFTDLTPVLKDMTLFARWSEISL